MNVLFLTRSGGFYGWLIKLWTMSRYMHVELEFSDGTRFSSLAGDGTKFVPPLSIRDEFMWKRVTLPTTIEQEQAIHAFCENEAGCAYDWKGIFLSQILGLRREDPNKWFCSEICDSALMRTIPGWPTRAPFTISPRRMYKICTKMRRVLLDQLTT